MSGGGLSGAAGAERSGRHARAGSTLAPVVAVPDTLWSRTGASAVKLMPRIATISAMHDLALVGRADARPYDSLATVGEPKSGPATVLFLTLLLLRPILISQ